MSGQEVVDELGEKLGNIPANVNLFDYVGLLATVRAIKGRGEEEAARIIAEAAIKAIELDKGLVHKKEE